MADAEAKAFKFTNKELSNRREKLGEIFRGIKGGEFKNNASDATCPSCPAFFVCGAVPSGVLCKKF
ncbi:hypothetical protein PVE_R2G0002 [Pseudomonas veronii 1YdBTEX2]|uniref:Uncharacterized protein n=1 Tax=Pseudomonas veronii 1YdBTEX2 TaxID=1295141 RepID=A0A1D3K6Y3_PSEVE|nr:hypothetical protein PVE_R2G0002 [Pseudomonas veronii 1YdBTEX2]